MHFKALVRLTVQEDKGGQLHLEEDQEVNPMELPRGPGGQFPRRIAGS